MWTPRKVIDQMVKYPNRFLLKDPDTGETKQTVDLEKVSEPGDIEGTKIDSAWLQPIENYLGEVSVELSGLQKYATDSKSELMGEINSLQSSMTSQILDLSGRADRLETSLSGLAPLNSPVLVNPTANTVAITSNSKALATTAAAYSYLNTLVAEWNK